MTEKFAIGAERKCYVGSLAAAFWRNARKQMLNSGFDVSLPNSKVERTDGAGRQGSDGQQRLRSVRSSASRGRPSRARHGSASHYNRWRISQGFVEAAPR